MLQAAVDSYLQQQYESKMLYDVIIIREVRFELEIAVQSRAKCSCWAFIGKSIGNRSISLSYTFVQEKLGIFSYLYELHIDSTLDNEN